jgi:hypothetical protein
MSLTFLISIPPKVSSPQGTNPLILQERKKVEKPGDNWHRCLLPNNIMFCGRAL